MYFEHEVLLVHGSKHEWEQNLADQTSALLFCLLLDFLYPPLNCSYINVIMPKYVQWPPHQCIFCTVSAHVQNTNILMTATFTQAGRKHIDWVCILYITQGHL